MHRFLSCRSRRSRFSYGLSALACCWLSVPAFASAQPGAGAGHAVPTAAVFATTGPQTRRVRELDLRVKRALGWTNRVHVVVTPKLDLNSVQLALDCRNDSIGCLRAVASEFGVDVLIAPAIELGQGDLVLTLLYFDARGAGSLTRVTHWQLGAKLAPETFAAVPELLDALLPRTPASAAAPVTSARPASVAPVAPLTNSSAATPSTIAQLSRPNAAPPAPPAPQVTGQSVPIAPCVVLASGVALLGAGLVTGIMMQSNADDYRAQSVHTRAEADVAANTRETVGTQATLANILYGVGAGAALIGATWLTLELLGRSEREQSTTQVSAALTPTQLGVTFQQQGDWL